VSDAVRDGRQLMENDYGGCDELLMPRRDASSWTVLGLGSRLGEWAWVNTAVEDAPEHPNYRDQFNRIEGVPV
jgi:hypothetical protein